jgi:tRNA uridine 5-carboxymethylaminomethyl modification enzyme
MRFSEQWRLTLEANPNVDFMQDHVHAVLTENNFAIGVETGLGYKVMGNTIILTSGTFLNGIIHIGEKQFGGGRMAESSSVGITASLEKLGFESGRMKTGTPPRVDGRSLDYSKMEQQDGDENPGKFSFLKTSSSLKSQKPCFITYTNTNVHDILREGFEKSPMFNGRIQGLGPRYCPSIEDKINRFAERDRHQIFVEPEGWNTVEIYVNGFSTSLPEEVQYAALKSIPGFEKVKMFRPGYAIEYDYFPPTQLKHSLETKLINNLFFAGQINGTTGYEEAACQGLMAGINAHQKAHEKEQFILTRSEAYIGVLIDDLITKGTNEPYRMFTSRAEFRILLRQDNADERLTPLGFKLGLADREALDRVERKQALTKQLKTKLREIGISPDEANPLLVAKDSAPINQQVKASSLITRPHISLTDLVAVSTQTAVAVAEVLNEEPLAVEQTEILLKYEGYIDREEEQAQKHQRLENLQLSNTLDYFQIKSLSIEAKEKLSKIQPATIGQAARVSGVSPSDISVLLVHLGR